MKDRELTHNLLRFFCSLAMFGVGYWLVDTTELSGTWKLGSAGEITVNAVGGAALFALVWLSWDIAPSKKRLSRTRISTKGARSPVIQTGDHSPVTVQEGASEAQLRSIEDAIAALTHEVRAARRDQPEAEQAITSDDEAIENAAKRLVAERKAAGRTYEQIAEELRNTSPEALYRFVDEQSRIEDAATVERHRERAVIGYRLGKIDEAKRSLEIILIHEPKDVDAISRLGQIAVLRGDLDTASALYDELLNTEPDAENIVIAIALGNMGVIAKTRGDYDEAMRLYADALDIYTQNDNLKGQAISYNNMGVVARRCGDLDESVRLSTKALRIYERLGMPEGQASCLSNLGVVARKRERLDEAMDRFAQALKIYQEIGYAEGQAVGFGNMGNVAAMRGDLDEAMRLYHESYEIEKQLGRLEGQADDLCNMGQVARAQNDIDEASRLWNEALRLYEHVGITPQIERVKGWLAQLPPEETPPAP